jgi:antitoxin HicB
MPRYPVRLTPGEEGLVMATFPDVPEAVCCGAGEEEAIARARSVLELVLCGYRLEGRPIPDPSAIADARTVAAEPLGA